MCFLVVCLPVLLLLLVNLQHDCMLCIHDKIINYLIMYSYNFHIVCIIHTCLLQIVQYSNLNNYTYLQIVIIFYVDNITLFHVDNNTVFHVDNKSNSTQTTIHYLMQITNHILRRQQIIFYVDNNTVFVVENKMYLSQTVKNHAACSFLRGCALRNYALRRTLYEMDFVERSRRAQKIFTQSAPTKNALRRTLYEERPTKTLYEEHSTKNALQS